MQAPLFRALDALAVDDGGGGARFARGRPATAQVKRVVDTIERTVPAPQIEIIVDCRARWQVLGNRPPVAAGAQDIHQAIDDFAHVHRSPVAAALGRRNERLHQRPFLVGKVARIAQPAPIVTPAVLTRPHRRPQKNQAAFLDSQTIAERFVKFPDGLSAPQPSPAGRSCLPTRRPRAGVGCRLLSEYKSDVTATPDTLLVRPARASPRSCDRGPVRRSPMSCRPRRTRRHA